MNDFISHNTHTHTPLISNRLREEEKTNENIEKEYEEQTGQKYTMN